VDYERTEDEDDMFGISEMRTGHYDDTSETYRPQGYASQSDRRNQTYTKVQITQTCGPLCLNNFPLKAPDHPHQFTKGIQDGVQTMQIVTPLRPEVGQVAVAEGNSTIEPETQKENTESGETDAS
jgi:hypothetical protein